MRQNDLNRAVANATGETVSTISHLGFLLDEPTGRFDSHLCDPGPEVIDWDAIDASRQGQQSSNPCRELAIA